MPEGHSVHRLALVLTELFSGEVVRSSSPQGRFTAGAGLLDGSRILPVQAWGKHLFIPFVTPDVPDPAADISPENVADHHDVSWVHVHLGLYGRWVFNGDESFLRSKLLGVPHIIIGEGDEVRSAITDPADDIQFGARTTLTDPQDIGRANDAPDATAGTTRTDSPTPVWRPPAPRGAVRLRIRTEHGVADLSGPNQCEVKTGAEVATVLERLGPDPLRDEPADRAQFIDLIRRRRVPVGALVMDQSVAAGPGNIYRAETLFRVGIHPYRPGNKVSRERIGRMWNDLVEIMTDGLETGTIQTIHPDLAPSEPIDGDSEASRWAVYHRTGRPCLRCGSTVREKLMQGRRLFWCPGCQR